MIDSFSGKYEFLSNFYLHPIMWDGLIWPSAEHLYQALKTEVPVQRELIHRASTPGEARSLGQKVSLRKGWNEGLRLRSMRACLELKFQMGTWLDAQLVATGDTYLLEGNWWHDNFFGDCHCSKCAGITGQNHLGKLLMQVRGVLQGL